MRCYLAHREYFLVFTQTDPRREGGPDGVEENVWLDGAGHCAGRDPADGRHYRLFRSPADRARAGFYQVVGVPIVVLSWDAFVRAAADCGEPVG